MDVAGLDKQPPVIASMFDRVAGKYDLTNSVLSGGQDRYWRRIATAALDVQPGQKILDIGAGPGTSSIPLWEQGAQVISADLSLGMLRQGVQVRPRCQFVAANATRLPFPDASFDAVTTSFAVRNVNDPVAALAEFRRVTVPGGRVVICEFSAPQNRLMRAAYHQVALRGVPLIAQVISSHPQSYQYLAESIRDWPDQRGMSALLTQAGWHEPEWRNLTGGVVAVHRATAR